jgi:hypothetical protein
MISMGSFLRPHPSAMDVPVPFFRYSSISSWFCHAEATCMLLLLSHGLLALAPVKNLHFLPVLAPSLLLRLSGRSFDNPNLK